MTIRLTVSSTSKGRSWRWYSDWSVHHSERGRGVLPADGVRPLLAGRFVLEDQGEKRRLAPVRLDRLIDVPCPIVFIFIVSGRFMFELFEGA